MAEWTAPAEWIDLQEFGAGSVKRIPWQNRGHAQPRDRGVAGLSSDEKAGEGVTPDESDVTADENKEGYSASEREEGRQNAWIHRAASGSDPMRDSNNVADDKAKIVTRPGDIERTREKPYG